MLEGSDASSSQRDSGPVPLIQVRDLKIQFAKKEGLVKAVDGVSFDLFANEIFGIVGETGSGKSITARSLIGLVPVPPAVIAGGSVIFRPSGECPFCKGNGCTSCLNSGRAICTHCGTDGCSKCSGLGRQEIDLLRLPNARMQAIRGMRIAMVFQDASKSLNPVLSIRDQIAEVFLQHRGDELLAELGDRPLLPIRRAAHQKGSAVERQLLKVSPFRGQAMRLRRHVDDLVAAALAEVQIANPRKVMDSFPHELSGGMKQRVMIAQAMACDPDVLIADEPTTALDTTVQARIIELIVEMQRRTQAAVLYISHDLSVVRTVCDRVGVMYGGQLVETGPARDVLGTPRHPYTRALLAAVPAMGRRRGELAAIKVGTSEVTIETPNCRFHTRCPQAVELCSVREPHLQEVARGTSVACFGYGATEPNELPADLGLPVVPRSEREQEDHRG